PCTRPWWGSPAIHVALIALAICAAYGGSLNAPYHFDDPEYIQQNPTIRSFKALSEIRVLDFRKLWWLSNAICYRLSERYGNHQLDKPDVRVFRAWNIACHFIAALALFGLVRRALRASGHLPAGGGTGTPYDLAAPAAAAIFAAHPLCTESVTYICGRDNGQGGMFYLLGLYAAAVAFERMGLGRNPVGGTPPSPGPRWPGWLWPAVWSMIFGASAVLTKENHLTFAGAVALLYACFYRSAQGRTISLGLLVGILASMGALVWGAAGRRDGCLGLALQLAILFTVAGGVLGAQSPSAAMLAPADKPQGWRAVFQRRIGLTWALLVVVMGLGAAAVVAFPYAYQRAIGALTGYLESDYVRSLCSQAYAVPFMVLRTVAPFGLNIDHDFPSISGPTDPRVITGAVVIGVLLIFGAIGLWRRWLGGFAVLLALLSIVPTNTIIERGDIVSERNFYLAAAGGACLLAWLVTALTSWAAGPLAAYARTHDETLSPEGARSVALYETSMWAGVLGCCLAGPFVSLTILRNNEWSDAYRLWDSARRRSPAKLRVLYNYGVAAANRKRYDEADMAFTSLIAIGEAKAEQKLFRPDESVQVKCFHLGYHNLANLQLRRYMLSKDKNNTAPLRRVDELYQRGLERTAYDPDLAYTYAQFLLRLGRATDTAQALQRSLHMHPWATQLFYPLGLAYLETGRFEMGRDFLSQAPRVQEQHTVGVSWDLPAAQRAEIYAFLGLADVRLKRRIEAKNDLRTSLDLDAQGVLLMLLTSTQTRNPKLKPVDINPPDLLIIALSQTRRDLLEVLRQSCDEALQAQPGKENTTVRMLRSVVDNELRRRGAYQKKRLEFGFMDDPDAD
ncbi:MAG: hypothetical protein NTW87_33015, partial [Planctomycetota bacterium]|nr:hypothetical protein [Planctomycetota bacterium]